MILAQAREEAATKAAGQEALRIAARDTLLTLKNEAAQVFRNELRKQVSAQSQQEAFLRDLLLQVCKRQIPELEPGQEMRVLLPERLVNLEDLRRVNDTPEEELLAQFLPVCLAVLYARVWPSAEPMSSSKEFKVALVDQQLMIDLTDHAIAALLSQYLLPRFRAVLEGYLQ
ncbi:hypothetical protein [Leptolyngbya sp. FACHB-261]|uniref:hypothetical protein n=1 Tax=Leptolyngbya sp. FACHB-261 TaxID=2692806 RepID=UPI001687B33F|nr:hypothetical protein [Leptolyngbya sp. FACHB-261]MBD2105219.1 hypothetical protein [Leptolyngbya sp. FACHB-261]